MTFALIVGMCVYCDLPASDVVGKWKVRIDGGGEIYSAALHIRRDGNRFAGTYESDGRRAKLNSVSISGESLTISVNTQRFATPVEATFTADVTGDKMSGEVDFDSGTQSRSYDFEASRLGQSPAVVSAERVSKKSAAGVTAHVAGQQISFRNGVDGYRDAVDAEIWAIAPSKSLLRQGTMTTDGNNDGGESQVLLQFGRIFGDERQQIPIGAKIQSAKLTIVAFDPGTTCYLHRLLVPWAPSVTWDGMANGISVDNSEASTVRDGFTFAEISMDKQLVSFDVTPTVQLWANGVENFGWVFVNTGGNGWDFYSSDWQQTEFRPLLDVTFHTQPGHDTKLSPISQNKGTK